MLGGAGVGTRPRADRAAGLRSRRAVRLLVAGPRVPARGARRVRRAARRGGGAAARVGDRDPVPDRASAGGRVRSDVGDRLRARARPALRSRHAARVGRRGGALGAAMSAAVWWPAFLYSAHSLRGDPGDARVSLAEVAKYSLGVGDVLAMAWPRVVGLGGADYWGGMHANDYPRFVGATVIALALAGGLGRRDRGGAGAWWAIVLGAIALAMGTQLGVLYGALHAIVPLGSRFRVRFGRPGRGPPRAGAALGTRARGAIGGHERGAGDRAAAEAHPRARDRGGRAGARTRARARTAVGRLRVSGARRAARHGGRHRRQRRTLGGRRSDPAARAGCGSLVPAVPMPAPRRALAGGNRRPDGDRSRDDHDPVRGARHRNVRAARGAGAARARRDRPERPHRARLVRPSGAPRHSRRARSSSTPTTGFPGALTPSAGPTGPCRRRGGSPRT